jgi:hypothetical protein
MPTVEEIFDNLLESWKDTDDYSEDDSEQDAENVSDSPLDSSGSSEEIELGDWIFMTTVHDLAEFI